MMRLWPLNRVTAIKPRPNAVSSQLRTLLPRISGEALRSLMASPILPKGTTMEKFVAEARRRAGVIERSIELDEVRDLYRATIGRKPRGRKTQASNSAK